MAPTYRTAVKLFQHNLKKVFNRVNIKKVLTLRDSETRMHVASK